MTRICNECVVLLEGLNAANRELTYATTALTSIALMGEILRYNVCEQQVEAARLRVDNARSALELHRATHEPVTDGPLIDHQPDVKIESA